MLIHLCIQLTIAIVAFDCDIERSNITKISLLVVDSCEINVSKMNKTTERIQLLQRAEVFPVHVYQCKVNILRTITFCGMHSHISRVPQLAVSYLEDISQERCLHIHKYGEYEYSSVGRILKIKANSTTHAVVFLAGSSSINGDCTRGNYTIGMNTWENVVVEASVQITIQDYQTVVKSADGRITLRSGIVCNYQESSCMDIGHGLTFWQVEKINGCNTKDYDVLYEGDAEKAVIWDDDEEPITMYKVNKKDALFVMTITGPTFACWFTALQTNHPRLIILPIQGKPYFTEPPIETKNMDDLFYYINSKFIYTEIHLRRQIQNLYADILRQNCEIQKEMLQSRLSMAPKEFAYLHTGQPGYTAIQMGEVLFLVKCVAVEVSVRQTKECFNELPVEYDGKPYYMTPKSHILQSYGSELSCSSLMSPHFLLHDKWESVIRSNQPSDPQHLKPYLMGKLKYQNPGQLVQDKIYPITALNALRNTMYPAERDAISHIIARGVTGNNVNQQHIKLLNLLSEDSIDSLLKSYWTRMSGVFSTLGNFVLGLVGVWVFLRGLKFIIDTTIHAYTLHLIYGFSWALIASFWNSLTYILLTTNNIGEFFLNPTKKTNIRNQTEDGSKVETQNLEEITIKKNQQDNNSKRSEAR